MKKKANNKTELKKYHNLVIATLDYYIDNSIMLTKTEDFNSQEHFKACKSNVKEDFKKGNLTNLKQWLKDLTEMFIETKDIKFNNYLQQKTGYDIKLLRSYFKRIDKITEKGEITTDNQFYEISSFVNKLSQIEPADIDKIELLNKLLSDYNHTK